MKRDAFDPVATFNHLINGWWKIVVFASIGGILGLGFAFIQPPLYQAEATFHASIDFTQINFEGLVGEYGHPVIFTQYDEDLALQVVERVLLAKRPEAQAYAHILDPTINYQTFMRDMQIQRYLARWHLRYRHEDPEIAQAIVNHWAELGMEALHEAQLAGNAESFVIISQVSEAVLPQSAVYYNRNTLVLAGTMVGLFAGVVWVDFRGRYLIRLEQES